MVKLQSDNGIISISGDALTVLAGNAATSCFGVKGMVGRAKEGGAFQLLRKESMSKGVLVTYNNDESVGLEFHIGVDKGVNILTAGKSIISQVRYQLQKDTGITVKNVDVFVDAIM